jgi:hypothetical protein
MIFVNSYLDRMVGDTTESFTTYFNKTIRTSSKKIRMNVQSIEIANLCYSFGTYESLVWLVLDYGGANTLKSYQVPITQNITTGTALATALQTLTTADGITWAYSTDTAKLTFTNSTGATIKMVSSYRYSENANIYNDCHDKIGYTQNMTSVTVADGATLTADSPVRMLRTNCYYLTANVLGGTEDQTNVPTPYYTKDPIIARVSASNFGTLSQFEYLPQIQFETPFKEISSIKFQLLDDQLRPITVGEAPITFSLSITIE